MMNALLLLMYDVGIRMYALSARILALFQTKAKLFVDGRKGIFSKIKKETDQDQRPKIWVHAASLGEFEQARPVIEQLKKNWPEYAIVLTFFSPSGYEIRKNYRLSDYVFYLPLDSKRYASRWLDIINPQAIFFAKYDFWYHYLHQSKQRSIPLFVFSASFRPNQIFFRRIGVMQRQLLQFFTHIFVQDEKSKTLLQNIGIHHCSVTGDTRIDRVIKIREEIVSIPEIEQFKADKRLLIGGSVWRADWQVILESFRDISEAYKLILAPHEIDASTLQKIEDTARTLQIKSVRFSRKIKDSNESKLLILDTMGMLASAYQYADAAFVGGAFGKGGLHNILEPSVYGIPTFFGPNFHKFVEAHHLIKRQVAYPVNSSGELSALLLSSDVAANARNGALQYFEENRGATEKIIDYLKLEKCLSIRP